MFVANKGKKQVSSVYKVVWKTIRLFIYNARAKFGNGVSILHLKMDVIMVLTS